VEAKCAHLDRRRAQGEDLVARALGVAVHVDEHVDAVGVDAVGRLAVARDLRQVDEVLRLAGDLGAERGAVVRADGVAEHLDARAVVHARDRLHQVRSRVVPEVRRNVPDAQPPFQLLAVFVRRLVKNVDLKTQAVLSHFATRDPKSREAQIKPMELNMAVPVAGPFAPHSFSGLFVSGRALKVSSWDQLENRWR